MQVCHLRNKTITAHLLQLFSPSDEKKGVWVASSMSVQTRLMNYSIHSGFLCLFSGSVFVPASVFLDALASLEFKLWVSQSFTFFTASASTGLSELFIFLRLSSSFVFIPGYVFVFVYVFLFYFHGLSLSLPMSVRKVIFLISDWQRSSHRLLY